jgi:protein SCO1
MRLRWLTLAALAAWLVIGVANGACAQMVTGTGNEIGVTQKPGQRIPLDVAVTDESGKPAMLRQYFGRKPVVLMLIFYKCYGICAREFAGMVGTLSKLKPTVGDDFDIVTVSIDPTETPAMAAEKKKEVIAQYGRPKAAAAWRFLVAPKASLQVLTTAVGYKYTFDPTTHRIAHPAVATVMTADGRISRYMFGVDYPTRDFKAAIADAGRSRIAAKEASPQLLGCLTYDPKTGKYHLVVERALKVGGIATALVMALSILVMSVKYRTSSSRVAATARRNA